MGGDRLPSEKLSKAEAWRHTSSWQPCLFPGEHMGRKLVEPLVPDFGTNEPKEQERRHKLRKDAEAKVARRRESYRKGIQKAYRAP